MEKKTIENLNDDWFKLINKQLELFKKKIVDELTKFKGEVSSLPNRDDKIGARILMPDGGGVNKFEITRKIEEIISHYK